MAESKTASLFGDITSFLDGVEKVIQRGTGIFDSATEPFRTSAPLEPPPTIPTVPTKPEPTGTAGQQGVLILAALAVLYLILR